MAAFVEDKGIKYPVAIDRGGATVAKYFVDGYPDYHVIDRSGNVRVADLSNGEVERVIEALLAEPAPSMVPAALTEASATAVRKDKRILALIGDAAQRDALKASWSKDRASAKFVSNEFEIVGFTAEAEPEIAKGAAASPSTLRLAFYAADGSLLGAANAPSSTEALMALLQQHRVPEKVAADLMAKALGKAAAQKKRVLVHLGAPW